MGKAVIKWMSEESLSEKDLKILRLYLVSPIIPSYLQKTDQRDEDQYLPVSKKEMIDSYNVTLKEYGVRRTNSLETLHYPEGLHRTFSMETLPISDDEDDI